MKAFVTGGSGFIGRSLIQKLVKKGYEVRALARSKRSLAIVETLGAVPIQGDLNDIEVMKKAMQDCDLVFHVAGQYKYGVKGTQNMDRVNVQGTENVLKTAWESGVPKILYTSTIAVLGDTKGQVVDETFFQGPPWRNDYDRTKWLAHHEVALPLIQKGAPIIILMPGAVYGPGDTSLVHDLMWFYYKGVLKYFFPGTDTCLGFSHVDDTAEGHILVSRKGQNRGKLSTEWRYQKFAGNCSLMGKTTAASASENQYSGQLSGAFYALDGFSGPQVLTAALPQRRGDQSAGSYLYRQF